MSELVERKVGIVSCSGEELAEGTVARLAALKVLNGLRPRDTVTICLPLFLARGAGDREVFEQAGGQPRGQRAGGGVRAGAAGRAAEVECRRAKDGGGHGG